jgi:hypothetical protein
LLCEEMTMSSLPSQAIPSRTSGPRGVPIHVNPRVAAAATELALTLEDLHYSRHYIDLIIRHAAATGTLAGSAIDPEDEAVAEAAFVDALDAEPVPYDSPAWDDESVILDVRMMIDGTHPSPFAEGPVGDHDAPDASPHARFPGVATLAQRRAPMPISGGAPADLNGDRRDFEEWLSQLDAGYPPADQPESDPFAFPRIATLDDRRAFQADIARWYRDNPSA